MLYTKSDVASTLVAPICKQDTALAKVEMLKDFAQENSGFAVLKENSG